LAYWINAYNALTVEGILRVYPTTSIRNHTAKLFGYNIWKKLYLYSGGGKINLDSIEHKVLRKMDEPRIHFAIVCASIGCPRLLNKAYASDRIDNQLTTNAIDFFSRSQNLQFDSRNSVIHMSSNRGSVFPRRFENLRRTRKVFCEVPRLQLAAERTEMKMLL